ncbi:MAG: hypothetical protein JW953_22040 [Anaerolineae bacterium]|nr:hypothetical protein [Anaerolineae bacterium]
MNQRQTNTPLLIAALIIIAVVGGLLWFSRQERRPAVTVPTATPAPDRSQPGPVQERVVEAMRNNQPEALQGEIGPSLQEMFSEDSFRQGMQAAETAGGPVQTVEVLKPPAIMSADPWNGQWADGCVRLARERASQFYVLRYYLEEGKWWLFATIEVEACP